MHHYNFSCNIFTGIWRTKALNMRITWVKKGNKFRKIKQNYDLFSLCTYKSKHFAQSQLNFAPSHYSEMVTFRNSDLWHIWGISCGYIGKILGTSWSFLGHILSISWAYLEHTLVISWVYLGHILDTDILKVKKFAQAKFYN